MRRQAGNRGGEDNGAVERVDQADVMAEEPFSEAGGGANNSRRGETGDCEIENGNAGLPDLVVAQAAGFENDDVGRIAATIEADGELSNIPFNSAPVEFSDEQGNRDRRVGRPSIRHVQVPSRLRLLRKLPIAFDDSINGDR